MNTPMWSQIHRELGSLVSKSPNSGMCGLEPWTAVNTLWPIISSDKLTVMRNSNKTQKDNALHSKTQKDNALHSTRVFPQCQSLLVTHAATQATDVFLRFQLSLSTFSGNKIFWLLHIFEKKMRVVFVREAYYVNIYSLFGLSCELDIQSLAILLAFVHLYIVADRIFTISIYAFEGSPHTNIAFSHSRAKKPDFICL